MNHSKKIVAISLTSVLLASAMGLSASAAYLGSGGSYGGNTVTRNTDCTSPYIQYYYGCQNGSDENSIWYGFDSSSCPASSDQTQTADAQTSSSDCTSAWQQIQQQLENASRKNDKAAAAQETSAPASTDNQNSVSADTAGQETAETPAATPSSNCDTNTCASANGGTTACTVTGTDGSGSCTVTVTGGSCATLSDRLFQCLNSIFEKCGLDLNKYGICLPGCSGSTAAEPTTPADDADAQPSQPVSEPSAPADSGSTETQPADNSGTGTTTDGNIDNLSFEKQVVALVNEQRAANGLSPLTLNTELSNVARVKSQDMHDNNYFDHTSPTYGSPFDMLASFGISYRAAGENIAMGYATPEAVMEAWMNSPGHRANILNSSYTQIGVGYVADGSYWTQEFIG